MVSGPVRCAVNKSVHLLQTDFTPSQPQVRCGFCKATCNYAGCCRHGPCRRIMLYPHLGFFSFSSLHVYSECRHFFCVIGDCRKVYPPPRGWDAACRLPDVATGRYTIAACDLVEIPPRPRPPPPCLLAAPSASPFNHSDQWAHPLRLNTNFSLAVPTASYLGCSHAEHLVCDFVVRWP